MSNPISSIIFCARNIDKAENQGKTGRWAVAVGQGKKVADYVTTLDNEIGKTSRTAVDALKTFAKSEKLLAYAGKAVDIASKNVNPLICVSSVIDVVNSDDKQSAIITNTAALGSMFAVEKVMKDHLDDIPKLECFKDFSEKILKYSKETPHMKGIPAIIHGVAFVAGSVLAYSIGEKLGKSVAKQVKPEEVEEPVNLKNVAEPVQNKAPQEFVA